MLTCIIFIALGAIALVFYLLEKCKRYSLKGVLMKSVVSLLFIATALAGAFQNQGHSLSIFVIAGLILGLLGDIFLDLKYVYPKDDKSWKKSMASNGAYIVKTGADKPDITILASGSEVNMALQAAEMVADKKIRVVSVPDLKKFENLPKAKQEAIIGPAKRIVCTEAGISMEWLQFTSKENCFCIDTFGTSGPANKVAEALGFTAKNLAKLLKK